MVTHTIQWFESEDGKIFKDEMKCFEHEINLLYRKSGVRFYIGDKLIEKIDIENDRTYDDMTDIFVDRSKDEENRELCELINDVLGWCYVIDAIEGTGKHYRLPDEILGKLEEVK